MLNITEETHKDLYYNVEKCVAYCKNIPETKYGQVTDYHMFWNVGLPFGRKQILPIKSYLATQNIKSTRLNVWSNVDLTENEYLKPFLDKITFRIWDPVEHAKDTPLESIKRYFNLNDGNNWFRGDLFRILCLHKYGGLYVDFDVIFLRDFAPLLDQEFMYKWSFQKNMINGAVMRLFKDSLLSKQLMMEMVNLGVQPGTINWSSTLYERVYSYNKNWTILPCGFFNTEWQIELNEQQKADPKNKELIDFIRYPFKKTELSNELYDGVFSWHWHNGWTTPIEPGSKWHILEQKMNSKIKELYGIESLL